VGSVSGGLVGGQGPVHAGRRRKAGGVQVAKNARCGAGLPPAPCWARCWTHRPAGRTAGSPGCSEEGSKIAREIYLSLVLNREAGQIAFVASRSRRHGHRGGLPSATAGEDHFASTFIPAARAAGPISGCGAAAFGLELRAAVAALARSLHALYRLYLDRDAQSGGGQSLDRHRSRRSWWRSMRSINIEDMRCSGIRIWPPWRDASQETQWSARRRAELNYVSLDGPISACPWSTSRSRDGGPWDLISAARARRRRIFLTWAGGPPGTSLGGVQGWSLSIPR